MYTDVTRGTVADEILPKKIHWGGRQRDTVVDQLKADAENAS